VHAHLCAASPRSPVRVKNAAAGYDAPGGIPMLDTRPVPGQARQRQGAGSNPIAGFLKILGPGFISGASDDDPSGIGTYAVAGAQFGFGRLWTALVTYPMMATVQYICAKLGMVSGMGLAGVIRRHYSPWVLDPAVLGLVLANTINVGADIGAIA